MNTTNTLFTRARLRSGRWMLALIALAVCTGLRAADVDMLTVTDQVYVAEPADPARQCLDLYAPRDSQGAPVMIFIHGGAWTIGDKEKTGHRALKAPAFVAAGWVFVSVNYRMAPAVGHPVYAQDVAAAVAWVHGQVRKYGGDPRQIYLMGHSAGAHLAAQVAADSRWLATHALTPAVIRGTVLLDGAAYDIPRQIEASGPRARRLYTRAFGNEPAVWEDASPARHVRKGDGVGPFMIWHVSRRRSSAEQARGLALALHDAGYQASIHLATRDSHATLNRELGQAEDPETQAIFSWLSARRSTVEQP